MPIPPPPTNLYPGNGTQFPDGRTQVTLSWNAAPHAANYRLTVDDLTEPDQRFTTADCPDPDHYFHKENIAPLNYALPVINRHAYRWSLEACNALGCSAPVGGVFSIGNVAADSAKVLSQTVPRTLQPGQQVPVSVVMQNTGPTTWRREQNYKLGSQFPQDNIAWGTNRIELPTGVQVLPGQTYTFNFTIRAPQTAGLYVFQWRMLVEGVHWFGQRSVDVPIVVGVPFKLTRDAANGRILDRNNAITFKGGHYYLFQELGRGDKAVVKSGTSNILNVCYSTQNEAPCTQRTLPNVESQFWGGQPWPDLFAALKSNNINLFRIFGTNGSQLRAGKFLDLYPFKKVQRPDGWRWQVFRALNCDEWETEYFDRLKAFAGAALNNGVAIKITLFNDYDLQTDSSDAFGAWEASPWNPDLCDIPPSYPQWAYNHLVRGDTETARKDNFLYGASAGLQNLQQALARKIVASLYGYHNVIFEIYNEPHRGSQEQVTKFNSTVIGWIRQEFEPDWRPLIDVNAFRLEGDTSEMTWWSDHRTQYPYYEDVDIVSYHGVAGYVGPSVSVCGQSFPTPIVDPAHIKQRFVAHRGKNGDKAMICSTDGASLSPLAHRNDEKGVDMRVVDGQIFTNINRATLPANALIYADLQDLAFWTLTVPGQVPGQLHFQNHSSYLRSFEQMKAALDPPIVC